MQPRAAQGCTRADPMLVGTDARNRLLVRVRQHLFLPGCDAHRGRGESARRQRCAGARFCSGRSSSTRAGATRRSTSIPPRAATCGATSSASAKAWPAVRAARSVPAEQPARRRASRSPSTTRSARPSRAPSIAPSSASAGRSPRRKRWRRSSAGSALTPRRTSPARLRRRSRRGSSSETDEAKSLGIFGAPAFVAGDGELFWGNDRLEAALDWAAKRA